jgi:hypothetical protein
VARCRFRRYRRRARFGIVAIRIVLLPAVRREAERRWRAQAAASGGDVNSRPPGGAL